MKQDEKLIGNKILEDAICEMYRQMKDEKLLKVFEIIKSRMDDSGHLVVAVKPGEGTHLELRTVKTPDGKKWFAAFTGFEEEIKKKDDIVSGFTASIEQLFDLTIKSTDVCGVIINPWDKALKLEKEVIKLIMGENENGGI